MMEEKPRNRNGRKQSGDQPLLLRLELINEWCREEDIEVLTTYGGTTERGTIVRDVMVPSDMPLHHLHYAIQRLFGWQNSHLRSFELDEKDNLRLTGDRVREWSALAGILYRGVPMDQRDKFWDDEDYAGGNFKVWLKKKYTGPYEFGGYTEAYEVVKEDIQLMQQNCPIVEVRESFHDYYERTKHLPQSKKGDVKILRKAPLMELTLKELTEAIHFDSDLLELMEKLEIRQVLGVEGSTLATFEDLVNSEAHPADGIIPNPVTTKLVYRYDFGDNWVVHISRYDDINELLEQGVVEASWMEEARSIVEEKYKPVCVHKVGGCVMDDVGGMRGYTDFLRGIYLGDKEEKEALKEWAKSMGWINRKVALKSML